MTAATRPECAPEGTACVSMNLIGMMRERRKAHCAEVVSRGFRERQTTPSERPRSNERSSHTGRRDEQDLNERELLSILNIRRLQAHRVPHVEVAEVCQRQAQRNVSPRQCTTAVTRAGRCCPRYWVVSGPPSAAIVRPLALS